MKSNKDIMTFEEKTTLLTGASNMQTLEIKEKNIKNLTFADGPHGVRTSKENNCTLFPNLCNLSGSWDIATAFTMGQALAKECIKHGIDVLLAPGVNIKRYILCGRNFEYFSEDPVLAGELAAAYINGIKSLGVKVCLKHFAANNQERDRSVISVEIDERTLREIYLKPFEIAVKKSEPDSIMCAYNKVNSIWCSENEYLLTDILRNEWGFKGVVISDWGAVHDICRSVKSGLDLQMPPNPNITEELTNGIKNKKISLSDIDGAVNRMLEFASNTKKEKIVYNREEQHKVARKIAAQGMVLLKNDNSILPLTEKKYKKAAVVGEYAASPLISGQGSASVNQSPEFVDSPLKELKKSLPEINFKYIRLYGKSELPSEMMWPGRSSFIKDISDCDVVLFFAGSMVSEDTENFDRQTAYLNPNVQYFIKIAKEIGKPVVLILQNGGGLILEDVEKSADSILEMWLAGEAAGGAVADVICGDVNPCGKLAETFPKKLRNDLEYPGNGVNLEYKERLYVGYRYYDKHPEEVLYPFGHGLSYTDFEYSNLCLKDDGESIKITFDLKNTGNFSGAEVVQIYVGDTVSTVSKPIKELKQFKKVYLKPNEIKKMEFCLNYNELSYYNIMIRDFIVENGRYDVYIGSSSQDIRLKDYFVIDNDYLPYSINCKGETMIG